MRVFLDANILFSINKTDLLFSLAEAKLFSVSYSTYVEEEAKRNLLARINNT